MHYTIADVIDGLQCSLRIYQRNYAKAVHDGNETRKMDYRKLIVSTLLDLEQLGAS